MPEANREENYSISSGNSEGTFAAPDLPYQPQDPKSYRPNIGLIGCGGITQTHLTAYRKAGYSVVAFCDIDEARAKARRDEFYPDADVYTDYNELLSRGDIEVVDIATHPADRIGPIEAALRAKKHVLSQKPFVLDLDTGERLVQLADEQGVKLAVNQNGRWAPHFSYIRNAVHAGVIGDLMSVHVGVHWDHTWTKGTVFEKIYDLVLYDFAIHWFDFVASLLGASLLGDRKMEQVSALRSFAIGQEIRAPMLAEAILKFEGGQSSLVFDAHLKYGSLDRTYVGGTDGSIISTGPDLGNQSLTLYTDQGTASPRLEGSWFPDGFHGTMGELLCAIEEGREPSNSARGNLRSLALCFAAIASASEGMPKVPGEVRTLPQEPGESGD